MNILETKGLTKSFGGVTANSNLDICIKKGSVTGLIGPNGSGKTTFINVVSGVYPATSGKVIFDGKDITSLDKYKIARAGIARTFQTIRLFERLSVLETVLVARHASYGASIWDAVLSTSRLRAANAREEARAKELLEIVGLGKQHYDVLGNSLPYGYRRSLEIARALALEPSLLLLDEPAAGMNREEFNFLQEIIQNVKQQGITILLVEHTMELVEAVVDHCVVLNYGQKLTEGPFCDCESDPRVIEAYLGKEDAEC
jgi:ABC-type branched-subunit amino acid transport system ATPase component